MKDREKLAWFAIRLVLGFPFLKHGVDRLQVGLAATAQHFMALGMSEITGYTIFAIEMIVGSMMILGIFPKFVTLIGLAQSLGKKWGIPMSMVLKLTPYIVISF
ncbi:DoxX family protein [Streptococcus pneumoniae]